MEPVFAIVAPDHVRRLSLLANTVNLQLGFCVLLRRIVMHDHLFRLVLHNHNLFGKLSNLVLYQRPTIFFLGKQIFSTLGLFHKLTLLFRAFRSMPVI